MGLEKERELLIKMRAALCKRKQCAAYLIFGAEDLERLLEARPKTLDELSQLKGFPKEGSRVTKWGEAIISIFINADSVQDFEISEEKDGELKVTATLKSMNAF